MGIEDMHYDFQMKFNKTDSSQYRNFEIPEKDWILNSAYRLYVNMVAEPRLRTHLGFEVIQRNTDDIRPLVKHDQSLTVSNNIVTLPEDYWHYKSGRVVMSKGACENVEGKFFVRQHDDEFEKSPYDSSSFEWRTVNGVFYDGGIKLFTDGTFTIDEFYMTYIKQPFYIHNAKDFLNGTYQVPSGAILSGHVDCELPDHTHEEIVDIAVMLASGQLQIPGYQTQLNKLKFNNLN